MVLILEVASYKGLPPVQPLSARFDERGGSVGRSPDNHLVLPDPEKFISRHHADIRYENGAFVYSDVSTGGTLLCNEDRLLTHGSVRLADGDCLKVGEYELRIRIEAAAQEFPELFAGLLDSRAPLQPTAEAPFNISLASLFEDDASLPPAAPEPSAANRHSFIGQPDAPPVHENFTPPGFQPIPDDFSFDDFLRDDREPPHATPAAEEFEFPGHLFNGLELEQEAARPLSSAAGEACLPTPPPGPAGAMPEFPAAADMADAPALQARTPAPTVPKQGGQGRPMPVSSEQGADVRPAPTRPRPGGQAQEAGRAAGEAVAPSAAPMPAVGLSGGAAPPPEGLTPPRISGQPLPAEAAVDLFACFLEGAGLAEFPPMTPAEQEETMKTLGVIYRDMIDGMMMVLRARTEEKREIRATVTTLMKDKNNPLKFIPTLEDAMVAMISRKYRGYIDSTQAVREGFADIMTHQLAVRAGMQAAMEETLKDFDPHRFEASCKESILFNKKAKCWDAYVQAYPRLAEEARGALFGEAFSDAYEKQMRILRGAHD